jgi:uncharacterized protein YcgL (UPF0745 family)
MTYVYLAQGKQPEDLPENLVSLLGELAPVMQLDLSSRKALANADIEVVREALKSDGYYLQLPPNVSVEELLASRFS